MRGSRISGFTPGSAVGIGYAIAEREVDPTETGGSPAHTRDIVLGVVRNGVLHRVDDSEVEQIEVGDRLLYVRKGAGD